MSMIKKMVKDLVKGDVLVSTGAVVISTPQRGIKTPIGKYEVWIEYLGVGKTLKVWNGNMTVAVKPVENSN